MRMLLERGDRELQDKQSSNQQELTFGRSHAQHLINHGNNDSQFRAGQKPSAHVSFQKQAVT